MVVGFSLWIVPRKKVGEIGAREIAGKFGEVLDVTLQERGVMVTFAKDGDRRRAFAALERSSMHYGLMVIELSLP